MSVNIFEDGKLKRIAGNTEDAEQADITPESIGAVAKAGDEMEGLLWLRRGTLSHVFIAGGHAGAKYIKVANITVLGPYVNAPISFTLSSRTYKTESRLYIKFANANSTDTHIQSFVYEGNEIEALFVKTGVGLFDLYIGITSEIWDEIYLTEYHNPHERTNNVKIDFFMHPEVFTELPDNAVKATLGGIVAEADHLTSFNSTTLGNIATINGSEIFDDKNAIGYFQELTIFPVGQGGSILHHAYNESWKTQLFISYMTGEIWSRGKGMHSGTASWTATRKMLDDKNYTNYVVPKTGGKFTGDIEIPSGKLITTGVHSLNSELWLCAGAGIECRKCDASGTPQQAWISVRAASFDLRSSVRYKENIVDLPDDSAIDHIMKYRPVICNYKDDAEKTPIQAFIAEEVAEINPYPVSYDEEGRPDAIDYSKFVPEIISMLQTLYNTTIKQQAEIEELRERIK